MNDHYSRREFIKLSSVRVVGSGTVKAPLALRAQAEKSDVHAVDLVAGVRLELLVKRREQLVADLVCVVALPADQMMVVAAGDLVDQLAVADMRRQQEALFGEEGERAVHGGFRDAGYGFPSLVPDLERRQVAG